MQAAGGEGITVVADVSKEADVKKIVDAALQAYGRIDIAFLNAGTGGWPAGVTEVTEELIDTVSARV